MTENTSEAEIGEISRRRLVVQPWFRKGYDQPITKKLRALKDILDRREHLVVLVFLGLWCQDCQEQLPKFIKILDLVEFPPERVGWINLDRDKKYLPLTEDFQIQRLPTYIFLEEEAEVGRIVENPNMGLVEDMEILLGN